MMEEEPMEEEISYVDPDSDPPPILLLPDDALHHIFSSGVPLRQVVSSSAVCRHFRSALSSRPFLSLVPPLRLLALRHPRPQQPHHGLHALDPSRDKWILLPLSFLPFPSSSPAAAAASLLYLWADDPSKKSKSLVLCNPLTRSHRPLPPLGSAWSRHGTVLASPGGLVLVLTELAALSFAPGNPSWLKFSLNLPSKPRSPVLLSSRLLALCDVGSPWRSQWRLYSCRLPALGAWAQLDRPSWGEVFDVLKRPRLVRGAGPSRVLMVGGLRSSFALDAPCSTVLILRLDLAAMDWDEAARMPPDMYHCFAAGGNNKVKVFGGDGRVWFSGKRVRGKMAMWEEDPAGGRWEWVHGVPGYNDGVYRGFVLDAAITDIP